MVQAGCGMACRVDEERIWRKADEPGGGDGGEDGW